MTSGYQLLVGRKSCILGPLYKAGEYVLLS